MVKGIMKKKHGYVLDTPYPVFFYKEMKPIWLTTIPKFLGFKTPDISRPFAYLELACATGMNLLACAIHHPNGYFVGVDFNLEHIEKAKAAVTALKLSNIEFIHADFSEFLATNTRIFDFIVIHGTYYWIAPHHQKCILEIVAKCLNDLGLLYLHYMCYPGSSALQPIQKLLNLVDQHTQIDSLKSAEMGKELFMDLNAAGAFVNNSKIESIINALGNSNAYLAHEFLTDHWQPLYSTDVHRSVFKETQMIYLGSANPCENMDSISIPAKLLPMIQNLKIPDLKEYLKDLARDAKQRIDLFQKMPKTFAQHEHLNILYAMKFKLLPNAPKSGPICFKTAIGDIRAPAEIISPVLEALALKEMSFEELAKLATFENKLIFLVETLFLLLNAQYIYPLEQGSVQIDGTKVQEFNELVKQKDIKYRLMQDCAIAIPI